MYKIYLSICKMRIINKQLFILFKVFVKKCNIIGQIKEF
uniref:Uncharacterized protein n=1 Tax=Solanum lycopersicum TaxID=4081 RepID=A0A3Q7G178_SOLLC